MYVFSPGRSRLPKKTGIAAHIVSFVFAADAALPMEGIPGGVAPAPVAAVTGCIGPAVARQGHCTRSVPRLVPASLAAAAILAPADIVAVRVAGALAVPVLGGRQPVARARG